MGTAFRRRLRAEATAVALSFVPLDTNFEASSMNVRLGYRFREHNRHNRHKPPKESGMARLKHSTPHFRFAQGHWGVAVPLVDANDDVVERQGPTGGDSFLGPTPRGKRSQGIPSPWKKSIAPLCLSKYRLAQRTSISMIRMQSYWVLLLKL